MKKMLAVAAVAISLIGTASANEILLDNKEIDLGNISDSETNVAVEKTFSFTRNAETPKKITLKYAMNFVKEECTEYEVKLEEIPEFKKTVCEPSNGGSFLCEEKIYSGLYNAKTECVGNGLTRSVAKAEIVLNFSQAVKLAPDASEKVSVTFTQKGMKEDKAEAVGRVDQSHSLYKVKKSAFGKQIKFKAL